MNAHTVEMKVVEIKDDLIRLAASNQINELVRSDLSEIIAKFDDIQNDFTTLICQERENQEAKAGDPVAELKAKTKTYVEEKADGIIKYMIDNSKTIYKESTCDYQNWDKQLHINFPAIADYLRKRGFVVTSTVNHGVTDWLIVA